MNKIIFASILTLIALIPQSILAESKSNQVTIEQGWVRAMPPSMPMSAAYGIIKNNSNKAVTLVKLSSPKFNKVEIHQTIMKDGIASMHHMPKFTIPASSKKTLAPKGIHIMLMGKKGKVGKSVTVEFNWSNGETLITKLPVKKSNHK